MNTVPSQSWVLVEMMRLVCRDVFQNGLAGLSKDCFLDRASVTVCLSAHWRTLEIDELRHLLTIALNDLAPQIATWERVGILDCDGDNTTTCMSKALGISMRARFTERSITFEMEGASDTMNAFRVASFGQDADDWMRQRRIHRFGGYRA